MDMIEIYLRIDRADIAYLKFVIESYEAFGLIRTLDSKKATVVVLVVPDFVEPMRALLDSLRDDIAWYEIPAPDSQTDWLLRRAHEPP